MYSPLSISLPQKIKFRLKWGNLQSPTHAFALTELAHQSQKPILMITPDLASAQQIYAECLFFNRTYQMPLVFFPDRETLPYDMFSPYQDLTSERLKALWHIPKLSNGIIITAASTIAHKMPPTSFIGKYCFYVKVGEFVDINNFRLQLDNSGYNAVNQVMGHGEYSIRGSIIDIFPMGTKSPIRIDLFDNEIDSIRWFEIENQRSGEMISEVNLLPAHEFPMDESSRTAFRQNWRANFPGNPNQCPIYQTISNGLAVAGIEYYLPLFYESCASFFDYLPHEVIILKDKAIETSLEHFWKDIYYRYDQYSGDITRPLLPPHTVFYQGDEIFHLINKHSNITLYKEKLSDKTGCQNFLFETAPELFINRKAKQPLALLQQYVNTINHPIVFTVESAGRREALLELFKTINLYPAVLESWDEFIGTKPNQGILISPIQTGFVLSGTLEVISESQLFGEQVYQHRHQKNEKYQQSAENAIRNLMELQIDDAIVHIEHGIGRYKGLQTLTIADQTQEFLIINYADETKLYVPVTSLHLISRYGGSDPKLAPLHRLGTDHWNKAKQKAAERIRDIAAELLEIYAKRQTKKGVLYKKTESYLSFASAFPFQETPDQNRAINEVLDDMASDKMMDRLICGDVGFGKTEVAMRAAFIAVENNKQVVMLVPTTLLAHQHYQTFLDRFADWPIRIEVLSRFKTKKESDQILEGIKNGTIDIIIGTHKLIQKSIKFAKLGLLIIDEEHRFGVQQKERIKALRAEIDILSLSATPIPRTLNLSLSGIRDLSLITTPPARRLSVKTFVYEWRKEIIREAILRELQRGGQIYFLHNEVETIENISEELKTIVPEAKLAIAHGQMRERELEKVMSNFYHHHVNILICTTIIESGIDVPTANTIIMNRADKLGLAQLHQLRGRVGRSHHQAYAYLLIPNNRSITKDAEKRLEAISMHEDLGAGFILANHDLEIRGAGEFLGEEQSGQIQSIGFDLYMELLTRAVNSLKSGKIINLDESFIPITEIDLKIPTLIPEEYISDIHTRLIIYKRIANARDTEKLKDLQIELIDRFGLFPQPLKNLFSVTEIKLFLEKQGIKKLEANTKQGKITFGEKPEIDPSKLIKFLQIKPARYKLAGQDKLNFFFDSEIKEEDLIQQTNAILNELFL